MKKKNIYILLIIFGIILIFTQFGFQFGNVRIGKQIDMFTIQDDNFENSSFYKKYYNEDKLIILNLWATWCKPCVAEMPMLNKVQNKFSDQEINFLSLSIDTDSVKLQRFLDSKKFDFIDITFDNIKYHRAILNTLEGNKTNQHIYSKSVPVTYIIKNKEVLYKSLGEIEEDVLIEKIKKHY